MKKTIRNHIDTNTTTRRLAEGLILERRVTENGIDLRVMLQRPLEEYDGLQTAAEAAYIEQYLVEKYRGVADVATILQLAS
ncbi:MAG: hypothetical protein U0M99_08090 [Oscillospiraceae bacterium]|jgi:hypothetical protein|nr:hypothetical protein [Oscillibacter sp.]